jgi:3-phenylpropionate/trans-cinnamate dioxygenase ferredoxin subunit
MVVRAAADAPIVPLLSADAADVCMNEFVRVCSVAEASELEVRSFSVPGHADSPRVLVNAGGELFALSGVCPHEAGDLSAGVVENGALWCPVHSSGFDCRTGAVIHPPARSSLGTYRVLVEDGSVYVRLQPDP